MSGEPVDLRRIADALEGAGQEVRHRNEHLTEMGQAITALVISTDALVIAIRDSQRRNRQFRWLLGLGGVLALVGVATAIALGIRLNNVANQNHSINQLIVSCVTPTGACSKAGDARTAAAIAELERQTLADVIAADLCAHRGDGYERTKRCIDALLSEQ